MRRRRPRELDQGARADAGRPPGVGLICANLESDSSAPKTRSIDERDGKEPAHTAARLDDRLSSRRLGPRVSGVESPGSARRDRDPGDHSRRGSHRGPRPLRTTRSSRRGGRKNRRVPPPKDGSWRRRTHFALRRPRPRRRKRRRARRSRRRPLAKRPGRPRRKRTTSGRKRKRSSLASRKRSAR